MKRVLLAAFLLCGSGALRAQEKAAEPAAKKEAPTKDEMLVCYMKLQGISQQMANDWRRWASAHLKAGQNYRSAIRALLYTLVYALLSALKAEAKKEAERTRP